MGLILLGPVEVALLGGLAVPLVLAAGALVVWPLAGTLHARSVRDRRADGLRADRGLRVDRLPHSHGVPPALGRVSHDLAHPSPAPLQERALLARDHEHDRGPRVRHRCRTTAKSSARGLRAPRGDGCAGRSVTLAQEVRLPAESSRGPPRERQASLLTNQAACTPRQAEPHALRFARRSGTSDGRPCGARGRRGASIGSRAGFARSPDSRRSPLAVHRDPDVAATTHAQPFALSRPGGLRCSSISSSGGEETARVSAAGLKVAMTLRACVIATVHASGAGARAAPAQRRSSIGRHGGQGHGRPIVVGLRAGTDGQLTPVGLLVTVPLPVPPRRR